MKKLKPKFLIPYLDSGLGCISEIQINDRQLGFNRIKSGEIVKLAGLCGNTAYLVSNMFSVDIKFIKPVLHPLSDLTKEIEVNGERFVPLDYLKEMSVYHTDEGIIDTLYDVGYPEVVKMLSYDLVRKLFEWHFDVFGLIEDGLAVNINEL